MDTTLLLLGLILLLLAITSMRSGWSGGQIQERSSWWESFVNLDPKLHCSLERIALYLERVRDNLKRGNRSQALADLAELERNQPPTLEPA
jgi:hypothetical protein